VSEDKEADAEACGSKERHHVQSKRRGGVSAEVYTEEDAASYVKKVVGSFLMSYLVTFTNFLLFKFNKF